MRLETTRAHKCVVVKIDADELSKNVGCQEFMMAAKPILETEADIVLDMSKINYIDTAGLAAILSCYRSCDAKHGFLRLACLTRPVARLFTLVRLDRVIQIYDTIEKAIASFNV